MSHLVDLSVLVVGLALAAFWQHAVPPAGGPRAGEPSRPSPQPAQAEWRDSSLFLRLSRLPGQAEGRRARLRLSLTNNSEVRCWIPGTFCQEFEATDPFSHAVRVTVDSPSRTHPTGPWLLGPGYGERSLHHHASHTRTLGPGEQLSWEFCLGELIQLSEGIEPKVDWERAAGPFRVSCQLSQPGHRVVSNTLQL